MRRGEVWWADLPAPIGRRPVVLLSRNQTYEARNQATVAYVTTRVRHIPVEVPLGPEDGLLAPCAVNLDNINTIRLGRLRELITALSSQKLREVERALRFALALPS